MFDVYMTNSTGTQLTLTDNSVCSVLDISGIGVPTATINTIDPANLNGTIFAKSKMQQRAISITVAILNPVRDCRREMQSFLIPGTSVALHLQDSTRHVVSECYIESADCPQFSDVETMTISLIAPTPYFYASEKTVLSGVNEENGEYKKYTIDSGDFGTEYDITASLNPAVGTACTHIEIVNATTGKSVNFNPHSDAYPMCNKTYAEICTDTGNPICLLSADFLIDETESKHLIEDYNYLASVDFGNLMLQSGENVIEVRANQFGLYLNVEISYTKKYIGW